MKLKFPALTWYLFLLAMPMMAEDPAVSRVLAQLEQLGLPEDVEGRVIKRIPISEDESIEDMRALVDRPANDWTKFAKSITRAAQNHSIEDHPLVLGLNRPTHIPPAGNTELQQIVWRKGKERYVLHRCERYMTSSEGIYMGLAVFRAAKAGEQVVVVYREKFATHLAVFGKEAGKGWKELEQIELPIGGDSPGLILTQMGETLEITASGDREVRKWRVVGGRILPP